MIQITARHMFNNTLENFVNPLSQNFSYNFRGPVTAATEKAFRCGLDRNSPRQEPTNPSSTITL